MASQGILSAYWAETNYTSARWSFEWASVPVQGEPGVTLVSWSLYTRGREGMSSPTSLYGWCEIYLNEELIGKNINNLYSFLGVKQNSGSFKIKHDAQGKGQFNIKLKGRIYDQTVRETSITWQLDTNYPYTKCKGPTSVSIVPEIQKPGGTITIKWDGAEGGIQNPISSYSVFCKVGSADWVEIDTVSKTQLSYVLPQSAQRGGYIQSYVIANGSIAGYSSDKAYSASNSSRVNIKPPTPTFSATQLMVPSNGSSEITLTCDEDFDGQPLTIIYKINGGKENQYTSKLTYEPKINGDKVTYTAWSYDGLEYSEVATLVLKGNPIKPSISKVEVTGRDLPSVNKVQDYYYIVKPTINVTTESPKIQLFQYSLEYSKDSTFSDLEKVSLTDWTKQSNYTVADIRKFMPPLTETGYYYRIICIAKDEIEETVPAVSGSYYITKQPSLLFIHNGAKGTSSIHKDSQLLTGYFLDHLYTYFEYDQGYNCARIAMSEDGQYIANPKYDYRNGKVYLNDNTEQRVDHVDAAIVGLARGASGTFYFTPSYWDGGQNAYLYEGTRIKGGTKTRINSLQNKSFSSDLCYQPFITGEEDYLDFTLDGYSSENENIYGFSRNEREGYTSEFSINIAGKQGVAIPEETAKLESSNFKISIKNSDLYKAISQDINRETIKDYYATLKISIENLFGEKAVYSAGIEVNFSEEKPIIEFTKASNDNDGSSQCIQIDKNGAYSLITDYGFLKEGMSLCLTNVQCKTYHRNPKIFINFLNRKFQIEMELDSGSPKDPSPGKRFVYVPKQQSFYTIEEIIEDSYSQEIKLQASSSFGNVEVEKTLNAKVNFFRHCAPEISFDDFSKGESDNNFTIKVDLSDYGVHFNSEEKNYKNTPTVTIFYRINDEQDIKTAILWSDQSDDYTNLDELKSYLANASFDLEVIGDWKYITAYLEIKIQNQIIHGENNLVYKTTKTKQTVTLTLYNTTPTLSYRPNKVGINYDFSKEQEYTEASLVIGQHSNAKNIYYIGNLVDGSERVSTFDLTSGAFDGIIIDGGSWG